ncbi:hypothetical protein CE91St36_05200 [Christensenellaceae bacterium]|nr:hypothetical protein CE91St36_05200 [Christensenellaceae bacterium]BDF60371.1 hypothetical protein CE91St37_05210 [Christensenellaceae bacterium]
MNGYQKEDLLDMLAKQTDCTYLSELRNPEFYPLVANILEWVEPNAYSLSEWEEAIVYITGEREDVKDAAQARNVLLKKIKAEKTVHTR